MGSVAEFLLASARARVLAGVEKSRSGVWAGSASAATRSPATRAIPTAPWGRRRRAAANSRPGLSIRKTAAVSQCQMQSYQGFGSETVGVTGAEAPAEPRAPGGKLFTAGSVEPAITLSQPFGPAGSQLLARFGVGEFGPAGVGKILRSRIGDLNQMCPCAVAGEHVEPGDRVIGRIEEIGDQHHVGEPLYGRQIRSGGKACGMHQL